MITKEQQLQSLGLTIDTQFGYIDSQKWHQLIKQDTSTKDKCKYQDKYAHILWIIAQQSSKQEIPQPDSFVLNYDQTESFFKQFVVALFCENWENSYIENYKLFWKPDKQYQLLVQYVVMLFYTEFIFPQLKNKDIPSQTEIAALIHCNMRKQKLSTYIQQIGGKELLEKVQWHIEKYKQDLNKLTLEMFNFDTQPDILPNILIPIQNIAELRELIEDIDSLKQDQQQK